ncbi:Rv1733c family protein [Gordonia sp. DT218]|uniref:Rv1733c family protein n=1 Tax=Gordonia sp. DT218 TaxID=3416659 RepID=UPI003CFAAB47
MSITEMTVYTVVARHSAVFGRCWRYKVPDQIDTMGRTNGLRYALGTIGGRMPWSSNPLLRRGDRMVATVGLVAVVVALLAVPLAVLVGCSTYGQVSARAASTTPVTARVVDVLPADPTALDTGATVRWMDDGVARTDTTSVPSTTRAGTTTRIWTDSSGNVVPQPPDRFGRVAGAAAVGVFGWLTIAALLLAGVRLVGLGVARRHADRWDVEWRQASAADGWASH